MVTGYRYGAVYIKARNRRLKATRTHGSRRTEASSVGERTGGKKDINNYLASCDLRGKDLREFDNGAKYFSKLSATAVAL